MTTTPTITREHDWRELRVTRVKLLHDSDGDPVPMVPPDAEPEVTYGCFACNMGLDEGWNIDCPGQDLFEEPLSSA